METHRNSGVASAMSPVLCNCISAPDFSFTETDRHVLKRGPKPFSVDAFCQGAF